MRNRVFWLSCMVLAACCLAFMTIGSRGNWDFVLPFRGYKLAALLVVGTAVSTATLLFQTVSRNTILTPSIMGFDALFLLIVTAAVFWLGAAGYVALGEEVVFAINLVVMIVASLLLFGTLLVRHRADIMRMILTGLIFGMLFRSLMAFMQRMIDPNEFMTIQVASFASFNHINPLLFGISGTLTALILLLAWRNRYRLDVLSLGHDLATNLGENVKRLQVLVLVLVSVLVAVYTAFVGPLSFLGLLVVSLARRLAPDESHQALLPLAAVLSGIVLVGGQTLLERVLGLSTPLAVVVDFAGGLLFLALVLRKGRQ